MICENMLMGEASRCPSSSQVVILTDSARIYSPRRRITTGSSARSSDAVVAGGLSAIAHLRRTRSCSRLWCDFNLGKLTSDDHGNFMGLLNDLFEDRRRSPTATSPSRLDHQIRHRTRIPARGDVRAQDHAVEGDLHRAMVRSLGPAGCGKTAGMEDSLHAQNEYGRRGKAVPVNPRLSRQEAPTLPPATRERKEGLMSVTFRDMSNNTSYVHSGSCWTATSTPSGSSP